MTFDFRLEINGVFKTWSLTNGFPTRALESVPAIASSDQPLEAAEFEGVVPNEDGRSATMMLWDRGWFNVAGDDPERSLEEGRIHFSLLGAKCEGEWTLLRASQADDESATWRLVKNREAQRRAAIRCLRRERSVLSGRSMREIAATAGSRGGWRNTPVRQSSST